MRPLLRAYIVYGWCFHIRKKCPKCANKAVRLYQNKSIDGKRHWISVAWKCTACDYVYNVASDTLVYSISGDKYDESFQHHCPKCDLRLIRVYQHKNPSHGKQEWISTAWYCTRCNIFGCNTSSFFKE